MSSNNYSSYKKIIDIINEHQPIKAKKIAEIMGIDKKKINSILYSQSMKKYIQIDKAYNWSTKRVDKNLSNTIVNADPLLSKLSKYYLQCLSREQTKFSVFARSKFNLQYAQLSNFNVDSENFSYVEAIDSNNFKQVSNSIKSTHKGYQAGNNPKQPCIGYPVFNQKIIAKSGKEYFMLKPIFIITIDNDSGDMLDIRLNIDAIQAILGTSNPSTILQEGSSISKLLELHANSDDISLIGDMLEKLKSEKIDWPWTENFSDYDNEIDLSKVDNHGFIHNVAIYAGMEQSKYTRGLESELQSLSKMSKKDIEGTALHDWLYPSKKSMSQEGKIDNILEPMSLNEEQKNAVKTALTSKLSVISGPPGTGKSQVVSNLLINSIYNNKSVLFSSKNNQAVDVVIERTNKLSSTPVLLHLSKQRKYSTLKHYCQQILSYVPSNEIKLNLDKNKRKLKRLNKELQDIDLKEDDYREEVSKSETTYNKLISENKKNEDFISKINSVTTSDLNRHIKLINKSNNDIEKIRKKVVKTYTLEITKIEKNLIELIKYLNTEISGENKGFLAGIALIFTIEEKIKDFNKKLKKFNLESKKSYFKLSKHKLSSLDNPLASKKTLEKDLKYIQEHIDKYLYKWKLEFGSGNKDWFFQGDKVIIKSILIEEDNDKNDESLVIGNFSKLNDSGALFPKDLKLSKYKELNDPSNLRKALLQANKDLKILQDCKDIVKYHSSLKKIKKFDDSFALSKKMLNIQEDILETCIDIWEDYTKVRMSQLESAKKKNIQEFLTVLGLLEGSDIKDGDSIKNTSLARKFNSSLKSIMKIAPCWSVTSLSAKSKIPFQKSQFEVLVIDEASQNDIASVLPLLYRCERAVIIGDENQLKHISSITVEEDHKLLDNLDLMENHIMWSYSQNSLFQRADNLCLNKYKTNLLNHFRSHSDIINFANNEFYGGSLRVATDYSKLKRIEGEQTIRWINVEGKATRPLNNRSLTNIEEANAIINELLRLKKNNYEGTIGIVTPYRAQATLIQKELHLDENLYDWFIMKRHGSINTVHLFQGDERDIMFFSTVVTKNVNPSVMNFFKPNLFNVAITRARAGLIVFGHQNDCKEFDHRELKRLANYINDLGNKDIPVTDFQLPEFKNKKYPHDYVKDLGVKYSEWEVLFYEELCKAGIKTIPQFSVDQYKLDLALFDETNTERKLNIEIDGVEYHRDARGELIIKDRIRNLKMIENGWDVKRFWVHEIRDNLEQCIQDIVDWKEFNEKVELFKGQQIL